MMESHVIVASIFIYPSIWLSPFYLFALKSETLSYQKPGHPAILLIYVLFFSLSLMWHLRFCCIACLRTLWYLLTLLPLIWHLCWFAVVPDYLFSLVKHQFVAGECVFLPNFFHLSWCMLHFPSTLRKWNLWCIVIVYYHTLDYFLCLHAYCC